MESVQTPFPSETKCSIGQLMMRGAEIVYVTVSGAYDSMFLITGSQLETTAEIRCSSACTLRQARVTRGEPQQQWSQIWVN